MGRNLSCCDISVEALLSLRAAHACDWEQASVVESHGMEKL